MEKSTPPLQGSVLLAARAGLAAFPCLFPLLGRPQAATSVTALPVPLLLPMALLVCLSWPL